MRLFLTELGAGDGALLAAPAVGEEPKVPEELIKHVEEELAPGLIRKMCRETSKDDEVSTKIESHMFLCVVPRDLRRRSGGLS